MLKDATTLRKYVHTEVDNTLNEILCSTSSTPSLFGRVGQDTQTPNISRKKSISASQPKQQNIRNRGERVKHRDRLLFLHDWTWRETV